MTTEPDPDAGGTSAGSGPVRGYRPTSRHNPGQGTTPPSATGGLAGAAAAWRHWRHSRPFWGGLFVILGGALTILTERAPLPLVVHIGIQGVAGYLVPIVIVLCGILLWFNPAQRTFYSILAILLALGSWITSNLGGFFIGMMLGLVGGSLAFAWEPRESRSHPRPVTRSPPELPYPGLSLIRGSPETEPETDPTLELKPEQASEPGRLREDQDQPSRRTTD